MFFGKGLDFLKKHIIREYFSIPNLMGYFRILLIPLYLYLYFNAATQKDYYLAALVMALSFLSDLLDGKVARKFNMITEFGKILDPVADKLTQFALAVSFSLRYPAMTALLILFTCKELIMGLLGLFMMKHGYRMNGAQKHGKLSTAFLNLVLFVLLVFPDISYFSVNLLACAAGGMILFSFGCYLHMYWQAWRKEIPRKPTRERT